MWETYDSEAWIAKAEQLKPTVFRSEVLPARLVALEKQPEAFQAWRVRHKEALEKLLQRDLRAGDEFILDFGEHFVGYLHMSLTWPTKPMDAPVRMKLTFGEVPAEVAEPFDPYSGTLPRSWLQDEVINIDVVPQVVRLPRRYAFRFVKVEVISSAQPVRISKIWCERVSSADLSMVSDLPDDLPEVLRELDRVSLRTLRNCMQTVFEDGPKRDRRLWLGDMRLQALTNYVTFRNYDLVKRCLYLFAGLTRSDGLVEACVYESPSPHPGDCCILDYAALFPATLLDYLNATGDRETALDLWPVARRQVDLVLEPANSEGVFIDPKTYWLFVGWHAKLDKQASMQGILIYALRQTLILAKAIGRQEEVGFLTEKIEQMTRAARKSFLDSDRMAYVSGKDRQVSWASWAWMVLAGVSAPAEGATLFEALCNEPGAIRPATPYLYHHVVEAMLLCGLESRAISVLQDYWGGMVRHGATTFWEVYDPQDPYLSPCDNHLVNSYCHAWSCTPAYFIRKLYFLVAEKP